MTKAEAALAAKIKCRDFRKNVNGTWTSGPNTKIGANAFPQQTFDIRGVSIGGADLATVLNRKCGVAHPARPQNRPPIKSPELTETPGQASPEPSPPAKSQESPEPNSDDPHSQGPQPRVLKKVRSEAPRKPRGVVRFLTRIAMRINQEDQS